MTTTQGEILHGWMSEVRLLQTYGCLTTHLAGYETAAVFRYSTAHPFPLYITHTHTKLLFLRPTWLAELRLWRCVAALSRPLSWRLAVWDSGAALNANNQSGAFTHALDAVGFPSPTSALALPLLLSKHTGILTVQPFIPLFSHTAHRKKSC